MSLEGFRPKVETHSPDHYNDIINQPFLFIDNEGSPAETTVYEAAKLAIAVAEKLQERVIKHYNEKDVSAYAEDKEQYDKLVDLHMRIKGVLTFLKEHRPYFRPDAGPSPTPRDISTIDNLDTVSKKLKEIASEIKKGYLTSGSVLWYLPNYINALEELSKG